MSSVDKIAVVYARYSSHGQTEQSIEGQIAAAQKYAEQHGYTIIHIYADRAMTGRNDDREEFQKMLSDTATHQFGVILLWKIDRFGRNREEIAFNRYRCKKNGVRVERVAEDVPDGPEGVILDSVLEGMAEYYSLQLAQNVCRGQRESAKKSQPVCDRGFQAICQRRNHLGNRHMAQRAGGQDNARRRVHGQQLAPSAEKREVHRCVYLSRHPQRGRYACAD